MEQKPKNRMIKRTVVLDPIVDAYVRKVWAMLIDTGADANYSTALNFLSIAIIMEARKAPGSLPRDTRRLLWDFVGNSDATLNVKGDDGREALTKFWGKQGLEGTPQRPGATT
ncbi:MAG: hypothetical protein EXR67_00410 [Dehalococcoidia bacterium]|nr:hypothetical protein [Dehalococcoidia bacterium]